ncbi:hypothetical protein COY95_04860 [Candidatus Woesearchaeota archaeon CG_4_10_14_0_8_um_filter_47_5]|nr:MAG: hypothetical protein COY95_04860 [Candidatus Woesearchaeota archaeon CG_4_10_14_0_8_um_filter_47_5]
MSFLDKLTFWKKKDPLSDFGGTGLAPMGGDRLGMDYTHNTGIPGFTPTGTDSFSAGLPPMGSQGAQGMQPGFGSGYGHFSQAPESISSMNSFDQQRMLNKDLEVISSKLDAIKSSLDNLNQRVESLERIAMQAQGGQRW